MSDHEEVGSVAEEAAKLFEALQGWAKDAGLGTAAGEEGGGPTGGWGAGLGAAFAGMGEHLATGAPECGYCPLCRAIALVRGTSPEVRHHLAAAAGSLLHAAAGLLETTVPENRSGAGGPGVEKIDLDDDGPSWDAE
jgi:hypothetical protein